MDNQAEKELRAGISIFAEICSKLGLKCTPTTSFRAGSPVRFDLSKGTKEVRVTLGYEFVTDLPGTKEFHLALSSYLTALALRFPGQSFLEFATLSGISVKFEIDFPFSRSTEGGDFEFVHVHTQSGLDIVFEANFSVHLTHTMAVNIASLESIITEPLVVNAVRKFIDSKQAVFYAGGKHPLDLQVVTIQSSDYDYKTKRFVYQKATEEEIAGFLKRKVYWLGFRHGNQATRVCIADPYDAAYLGVSEERLQQAAAILAADDLVQLDSAGLYASIGAKLLLQARDLDHERAAFFGGSSSTAPVRLPPKATSPEATPHFDVFVSHATEDKAYVEPLIKALEAAGIRVWFDKTTLEWGDDLRVAIDRGLTTCRYGIVVFSQAFLRKKKWTEYELNALFAREQAGNKLILPIWHEITHEDLLQYSPAFADRLAKLSSTDTHADIVKSLLVMLGRSNPQERSDANPSPVIAADPKQVKPNAIAYALYETKGENALKAAAYVRPSILNDRWFTFENSFGEVLDGTLEETAVRFATFDKSLTMKSYIRMHHANSGDPAFNL